MNKMGKAPGMAKVRTECERASEQPNETDDDDDGGEEDWEVRDDKLVIMIKQKLTKKNMRIKT